MLVAREAATRQPCGKLLVVDLAPPPGTLHVVCKVLNEREDRDTIAREEKAAAAAAAAAVSAAAAAARSAGDTGAIREGGEGVGGGGGGGGPARGITTATASRRRGTRAKSGRPLAKAPGERTEYGGSFGGLFVTRVCMMHAHELVHRCCVFFLLNRLPNRPSRFFLSYYCCRRVCGINGWVSRQAPNEYFTAPITLPLRSFHPPRACCCAVRCGAAQRTVAHGNSWERWRKQPWHWRRRSQTLPGRGDLSWKPSSCWERRICLQGEALLR